MSISDSQLPHGARGMYLPLGRDRPPLRIEFGTDKVMVFDKPGWHYTLHFGGYSGVIDIHRTREGRNGSNRHRRICGVKKTRLFELLEKSASITHQMFSLLRPLRVGWMRKHNIGIVRIPIGDAEIEAVTCRGKRRRLVFDEPRLTNAIRVPECLEGVWDFPDGPFALTKNSAPIGIGLKLTNRYRFSRLFWFKLRDLNRLARATVSDWLQELSKSAGDSVKPPSPLRRPRVVSPPAS